MHNADARCRRPQSRTDLLFDQRLDEVADSDADMSDADLDEHDRVDGADAQPNRQHEGEGSEPDSAAAEEHDDPGGKAAEADAPRARQSTPQGPQDSQDEDGDVQLSPHVEVEPGHLQAAPLHRRRSSEGREREPAEQAPGGEPYRDSGQEADSGIDNEYDEFVDGGGSGTSSGEEEKDEKEEEDQVRSSFPRLPLTFLSCTADVHSLFAPAARLVLFDRP